MAAWLNGRVVDGAQIDVADRGFTLGDGLFETMRLKAGDIRRFDRHLERLSHGAHLLGIPLVYEAGAVRDAVLQLAHGQQQTDGVVRLTLSRGAGARGLLPPVDPRPTMAITLAPLPPPLGPARVSISTLTRRNEFSPLAGIKSLNYLDAILARQDAAARGFDEVILLNTQGRVAETSVCSLFAIFDGKVVTPPISDGALPGVARALVIEALGAVEQSLVPADLFTADELVLTNVLGARSISEIDGELIGTGEILGKIQQVIDNS